MKVIGIEIKKAKASFFALEINAKGKLTPLSGDLKYLTLENDTDSATVRKFMAVVHKYFRETDPDIIAIIKRQTKGRFKSAPVSFKIEGLIQCYKLIDIEFVQPMSIKGFYKKNEFPLLTEDEDLMAAARLAYYLSSRE